MTSKNRTGGCCCQPCDCCVQQIYVCVCGSVYRVILCSTSGKEFSAAACCDCGEDDGTLYLNYVCDTPETLGLEWTLICGEDEAGGTIDISDLCEGDTIILEEVTAGDCTLPIRISDQDFCCEDCRCCDPPTTATITLTNATYYGNGTSVTPGTPGYDVSGEYTLNVAFGGGDIWQTEIQEFQDGIFTLVAGGGLVIYRYIGIQALWNCAVNGTFFTRLSIAIFSTDPMPPAPEPPAPPYDQTIGIVTGWWDRDGFLNCVPQVYEPFGSVENTSWLTGGLNDWDISILWE